jgi:thioredoxin 2
MSDSAIVVCPTCGAKNRVPTRASGRPRCAKCKSDLAWVVAADDSDLAAALDTRLLVLIDLWAPWCGPCRMVAPILERLASSHAGALKVVKINVDHSPAAAQRFGAQSIPTLVLLKDGQIVERIVGAQPEPVLDAAVRSALA